MEKVSKNSTTSRKPKRTLFERAALNPVTATSMDDGVKAFTNVADKAGQPKDEPKLVPLFDPDEYIAKTYGELNATNHILKAILREVAIVAHK